MTRDMQRLLAVLIVAAMVLWCAAMYEMSAR